MEIPEISEHKSVLIGPVNFLEGPQKNCNASPWLKIHSELRFYARVLSKGITLKVSVELVNWKLT